MQCVAAAAAAVVGDKLADLELQNILNQQVICNALMSVSHTMV
jgi:hypothetical protein